MTRQLSHIFLTLGRTFIYYSGSRSRVMVPEGQRLLISGDTGG